MMPPRYADSVHFTPAVAEVLDSLLECKETALLQANNLLLDTGTRARFAAEAGVYGYAELRLRIAEGATVALLREVEDLRAQADLRAARLAAEGSLDPSAAAAEAAYRRVAACFTRLREGTRATGQSPCALLAPPDQVRPAASAPAA